MYTIFFIRIYYITVSIIIQSTKNSLIVNKVWLRQLNYAVGYKRTTRLVTVTKLFSVRTEAFYRLYGRLTAKRCAGLMRSNRAVFTVFCTPLFMPCEREKEESLLYGAIDQPYSRKETSPISCATRSQITVIAVQPANEN